MAIDCSTYQWGEEDDSTGPLGIDYVYLDNCLLPHLHFVIIILMSLWIIYLMNLLANTASNYFSPTLGTLCDKLNLAYDIAGVTFLAFGNGAPDFFSLLASVSGGVDIHVALGALLGGGVFICTVVVGCVAILCPCDVSRRIFSRDVAFFLIANSCVLAMAITQHLHIWFAVLFLAVYFAYVAVVLIASWFSPAGGDDRDMMVRMNSISGDISMTDFRVDSNAIQTAFWHRDAEAAAASSASGGMSKIETKESNASTSSGKRGGEEEAAAPTKKSGYSFLILNDSDDDDKEGSDDSPSRERKGRDEDDDSGTINLSGGFAPAFDAIIVEDYCSSAAAASHAQGAEEDPYFYNNDDSEFLDETSNSLEENLLPSAGRGNGHATAAGSSSGGGSTSTLYSTRTAARMAGNMKSRNNTGYQTLLTSLYWQQWMVRRQFKKSVVATEWSSYPWWYKLYFIVDYPVVVLRDLTIPTLDNSSWSKYHAMAHPILDPILIAFLAGGLSGKSGGIPVILLCILVGMVPSAAIYALTHHNRAPSGSVFTIIWILGAFLMCIVWIYLLAGELITCLSALGSILDISPAFLGLTVLAWGNSCGDFFTNTAVARQGLGEMALAGCYGGPVFNILMGLGVALVFATLHAYPHPYTVRLDVSSLISIAFLYIAMISTSVIIYLNGFKIERTFGIFLLSLYAVYTVFQATVVAFQ
mmetsp:Transcript_19575/g.32704  ORF Transcript_19575/g.32704 Transcript_19575/m.32704 type:complete len:700 (+) Transcript_19575:50-2149(+)